MWCESIDPQKMLKKKIKFPQIELFRNEKKWYTLYGKQQVPLSIRKYSSCRKDTKPAWILVLYENIIYGFDVRNMIKERKMSFLPEEECKYFGRSKKDHTKYDKRCVYVKN